VNQQQTPCSPDDSIHFQNLNSGLGSIAEVMSFTQHPTDPLTLLAGLGANGTVATGTATTMPTWPQIVAGEGGTVAIDQNSPQKWYVSTEAGVSIRACGNGNACAAADFTGAPTIGYGQTANDTSLIETPFLLDPTLTTDIVIGTCRVWRGLADSGLGWPGSNAISTMFGGPQNTACNGASNPVVRSLAAGGPASGAVAVQNSGSTILYAGLAGSLDGGANLGGHIFANFAAATANSSTSWIDIAKSFVTNDAADAHVFNPGGFDISSIVSDPHDATGMTVYATVKGFAGNGLNAPHVYQSSNGGGSWINISSNLPNMPANAVLVDPNDGNTLYVAMDSGVYVTTAAGTCTSSNCWSLYGTSLPNSPVVELASAVGMTTGDGRTGELRAATYGRGIWQIPLLTAAYPAAPEMTLNPVSLNYSPQAISTSSLAQTLSVTNTGNAALTITHVTLTGDFNETDNCVGPVIAVGASCVIRAMFLPSALGTRVGVVTVYGNVAGGQATASLSGTGTTAAAIILNPITLTYAGTNVGTASTAQNITISNMGGVTATLQTPIVTTNFVITANTCGPTLASNVGCTVSVAFNPTTSGTLKGSLSISDSSGMQTASLTGVGVLPATDTLTPISLTYSAQQIGTLSAPQQVILTNMGDTSLMLIAGQINSGDFTVVNSCGNSLNGHSSCSLLVTFVPKSLGLETGELIVSDQYRSQIVTLNGTGVAPPGVSLSPSSTLTFAPTGVGLTATAQTVTLTNNGGLPLLIQSITVSGDFAIVSGSNTCGTSLPAGSACTVQLIFAPSAPAARTGSITVVDNATSLSQSLQLTGTGVDFSLTTNGSTSQTISAGYEAVYPLLLSSAAGVPGTVSFTCTSVPTNAVCVVNPSAPSLGSTMPITVTLTTSVASLQKPLLPGIQPLVWLALLLPLGLLRLGQHRAWQLSVIVMMCSIMLIAGCGTSRLIPQASNTLPVTPVAPTPSGVYTLVVTGSSVGLARSVQLTLIVE